MPTSPGHKAAALNVTGAGVTLSSATLSGSGTTPSKITLSPAAQSFGDVPIGMKSSFAFVVTNVGGADAGKIAAFFEGMDVTEFVVTPDASCVAPLAPMSTCSLSVTFTPMRVGPKTASLRVTASPGGFATAALTGNGVTTPTDTTIMLSSPAPDPFATIEVGSSSTGLFVVKNTSTMIATGKITPTISGSNANEFAITGNACPDALPPGMSCVLTVKFTPMFSGRRTANLQVTALPGGFAILPISGNAIVSDMLSISPTTRNFNTVTIGQPSTTQSFQVRSLGTTPTDPLMVDLEGTDMNNFQITYNDCQNQSLGQSRPTCRIDVRFAPQLPGGTNLQKSAALGVSAGPGQVVRASLYGIARCPDGASACQ
jgi:hypothetical protein